MLHVLAARGFASSNIVLGIGSYTYQHVTRDTWGFAVKATYGEVNGVGRAIFKDPVTDSGDKTSRLGLLFVNEDMTVEENVSWDRFTSGKNKLGPVWSSGRLLRGNTFDQVQERAMESLNEYMVH